MADKAKKTEKTIHYWPTSQDEQDEYFAFIEKQREEAPVVKVYHGKWKELTVWADEGKQFYEWKGGALKPVPLKKRIKRVVVNLMKPLKEALEGKIKMMHSLAGTPNSGEAKDIASGKVATKLIAHNDYINDFETLYAELKDDVLNTGNGFMSAQWLEDDSYFGFIPITGEGVTFVEGKVVGGKVEKTKEPGEVIAYVPSVYNCRPDPAGLMRKNWRWFIELKEVPVSVLLEAYPKIKKFQIMDQEGGKTTGGEKFSGLSVKTEERQDQEGIREEDKTVIVDYYWEKKSNRFKKGRLIITLGKLVLHAGENPALGEIPFWHYGFKKCGNSLWHTGPMYHVQPIQKEFNRLISIISEHIEGWRPKLAITPNALRKKGAYHSGSLEIVEIDDAAQIKPIQTPELSSAVSATRDFYQQALGLVANVHEVSYAQLPEHATRAPASLYSMMLEQESEKLSPIVKKWNKNIREMGSFRLRLMDKYYERRRMIKVVGEGEKSSIEYFKGADLNGNYDVKVVIGVSLHQSKIIQQRLILELHQAGLVQDPNLILKMLHEGDISEQLRGDVADEARAERENQAFLNDAWGKFVEKKVVDEATGETLVEIHNEKAFEDGGVMVWAHDDHAKHMDIHTNFWKGEEVQSWKEEKRKDFELHIDEHFKAVIVIKKLMESPMEQAGPGGGSPEQIETGGGLPSDGEITPEVSATREMTA